MRVETHAPAPTPRPALWAPRCWRRTTLTSHGGSSKETTAEQCPACAQHRPCGLSPRTAGPGSLRLAGCSGGCTPTQLGRRLCGRPRAHGVRFAPRYSCSVQARMSRTHDRGAQQMRNGPEASQRTIEGGRVPRLACFRRSSTRAHMHCPIPREPAVLVAICPGAQMLQCARPRRAGQLTAACRQVRLMIGADARAGDAGAAARHLAVSPGPRTAAPGAQPLYIVQPPCPAGTG